MKNVFILFLFLLFVTSSCKNASSNKEEQQQDNDLNVAIAFLQAALKGDFKGASAYMLHDSINDERLDAVSRMQLSPKEKQGLWDASITIHNRNVLNDTTSIIIYSNSFHKENQDTLKIVKKDSKWLVDFKYLFDHDWDTIRK